MSPDSAILSLVKFAAFISEYFAANPTPYKSKTVLSENEDDHEKEIFKTPDSKGSHIEYSKEKENLESTEDDQVEYDKRKLTRETIDQDPEVGKEGSTLPDLRNLSYRCLLIKKIIFLTLT